MTTLQRLVLSPNVCCDTTPSHLYRRYVIAKASAENLNSLDGIHITKQERLLAIKYINSAEGAAALLEMTNNKDIISKSLNPLSSAASTNTLNNHSINIMTDDIQTNVTGSVMPAVDVNNDNIMPPPLSMTASLLLIFFKAL